MMKSVYFDTNIFDHLLNKKNSVTKEDEKAVRLTVKEGKIEIPLSLVNLEEAFIALEDYPDEAKKTFNIISELSSRNKIIKPPEELLTATIENFDNSSFIMNPFYDVSVVKFNIKELWNTKRKDDFKKVIEKVKGEKINFKLENIKSRNEVLAISKQIDYIPNFYEYWKSLKIDFARGLIEEVGVIEKYKYKDINRLLQTRSVRLCVGRSISYIYGQTFLNKKPDLGDSRDMKHAVSASAADIFLTHDTNLAELMKRIPIENYEVLGHIHELLKII